MKKLKGFTLVELLAAMAIIAVLIGLAGFGITTALRASRDNQRQKKLDDIQLALTDYLLKDNTYPTSITYDSTNERLVLNPVIAGDQGVPINSGATTPGAETATSSSQYCYYIADSGGYVLGVKLESGNWYELGTSTSQTCADTPGTPVQ